ncbi:hypothetical protein M0657_010400 [Pyricularia oryzae]|nr:hypothetical protein M9X92_011694 [Pyricularia oryzae]KAI7912598.1 hypothetical protein M0657_010400 [Pyricularia oryzae]
MNIALRYPKEVSCRDVVELPPYGADAKDTDKKRVKRRQLVAWLVVAGLTAGVALGWGARKHD